MEFKCTNCGNMFDDALGVCPACGSPVDRFAGGADFVEQLTSEHAAETAGAAGQTYVPPYQSAPQTPPYTGAQQQQPPQGYQFNYSRTGSEQTYQQQPYGQQSYYPPQPGAQMPGGYAPQGYGYGGQMTQQKSKLVAGLLGIFLGVFGVHNFYLGYTGKAVSQLLISLLTCFIFSPVSAIWGFIEGILIIVGTIDKDANGCPLGD